VNKKDCPDFNINNDKCCNGQVHCIGLERCRKKYPALHKALESCFDEYRIKIRKMQQNTSIPSPIQKSKLEEQKQNDEHKMTMTMGELRDWLVKESAKATEKEKNLSEEERRKLHYV
jgi:hypothetical protein